MEMIFVPYKNIHRVIVLNLQNMKRTIHNFNNIVHIDQSTLVIITSCGKRIIRLTCRM